MSETPNSNAYENYDLKAEAPEARVPSVRFAFEFQRQLDDFRKLDAKANIAKRSSRRMGYASIGLVLVALLIASSAPVLHDLHVSHDLHVILGYLSAGLGLLGAIIAFAGMHGASPRRAWLRNRLKTETMRIFHFHHIAARLPEIARVKGDAARQAAYLANREAGYDVLMNTQLANPDAVLTAISTRTDTLDNSYAPELALSGEEDAAAAEAVVAAWVKLRLDWQLGYCEAKLAAKSTGKRMSSRQTNDMFSFLGWLFVGIVIALHVIGIVAEPLHLPRVWLEVFVIWTALIALASRALEDGLQPQREVERYEQYRASILVARQRLTVAQDLPAKLEIMRSFERTSLEEMRIFMRTHAGSSFML